MAAWSEVGDTRCPVACSQGIVGDRWTILVLRELFMANRRFEGLQAQTGATPQMLTARLKKLEADGLIERQAYSTRPARHEYVLTPKGEAFYPVILALRAWGESWVKPEGSGVAVRYTHRNCGKDPGLGPACQACGVVMRREDLVAELAEDYARERSLRQEAFKAGQA